MHVILPRTHTMAAFHAASACVCVSQGYMSCTVRISYDAMRQASVMFAGVCIQMDKPTAELRMAFLFVHLVMSWPPFRSQETRELELL